MRSENFPPTEAGDSWTEVVFKCPRNNWVQVLRGFFSHIELCKECLIPHYTIRSFEPASDLLIIEFKILRRQQDEKLVKSKVMEFLKGYDYEVDPEKGDRLFPFHFWIKKGTTSPRWTRERCLILSKISKFVLEIINSDTVKEDKEEWTHLFSNMMAMFEVLKIYYSPEIILSQEKNPYKVLKY